jgi:hypothetical protein
MYAQLRYVGDSPVLNGPYFNNDPLTYCLGDNISQRFNHGSNADIYGQNSAPCQAYLASRCAANWDSICEQAYYSKPNVDYVTRANPLGTNWASDNDAPLTNTGDILLLNTARYKYLSQMYNCKASDEPFDPLVMYSPQVRYWKGINCVPVYEVSPKGLDQDPVMNKLLDKPWVAKGLLRNIYNTMKRKGTLGSLRGTHLGNFFNLT